MKYRMMAATMALSLSLIGVPALMASPLSAADTPVAAKQGTGKVISLSLQNTSADPMTVQAGNQQITIAPKTTSKVKVKRGYAACDRDRHAELQRRYAADDGRKRSGRRHPYS